MAVDLDPGSLLRVDRQKEIEGFAGAMETQVGIKLRKQ